jgi:UDP-2-acetamido-2,6-beta-L-arabino-hexul-4-ose reductase
MEVNIVSSDHRGIIADIPLEDAKHMVMCVSHPDDVRGNHYHKLKNERFIILRGKALVTLVDINTLHKWEGIKLPLTTVYVSPNISHKVVNIGNDDLYLLDIADREFDPTDTYAWEIS